MAHLPTYGTSARPRQAALLAAKTKRHHRKPDDERSDTHRGDADLLPHAVRLTVREGTSALIRAYN
jgi:hypothetical protein